MMIIGITGTMGAGKSTVSAYLESKGYQVYNTDLFTRRYYDKEGVLYPWLIETFTKDILNEDMSVNRKKLAEVVFHDPAQLSMLESAVFKAVREDITRISYQAMDWVFFEVPLLFEADMADLFDVILCIDMEKKRRHELLIKRGMDHHSIEMREKRQISAKQKRSYSDFVIENNGDLKVLYKNIDKILGRLKDG